MTTDSTQPASSSHLDPETSVYVLSSDDVERIDAMMQLLRVGFLELLESRRVRFPNPLAIDPSSAEEKLYQEKDRIVSAWIKQREF